MNCTACDKDLDACVCPDLNERMRRATGPGGRVVSRWCAACDRHYTACRCEEPVWRIRSDGVLLQMPDKYKPWPMGDGHEA